jgi:UDP-N-acetylmuramoyl-L-alanyl-D-glutamate--2,6-diaminopimelate ligase
MTLSGTVFRVRFGEYDEIEIATPLIGAHNVANILAAASCTYAMGYELEEIKAGVENLTGVPGRLEDISLCQEFKVFVDYAHTPEALRNVLAALRPLTPGKLIVVFGCGGDRDRGKRPLMGRAADELSDVAIVTSDNPRSEEPEAIIRDIEGGMAGHASHAVESDRARAIRAAVLRAGPGDVVLIAGKGHERRQIFRDGAVPFDDRLVAYEALKERLLHAVGR